MAFINDSNIGTKSGLDEKFFTGYDRKGQPHQVMATDETFFRQRTEDQFGYVQNAEFAGPNDFSKVSRGQNVPAATVRIGNKQTIEINEFIQDVEFTESDMKDTDAYNVRQDAVIELGVAAGTSSDRFTMEGTYGNPFDATLNPTPDGLAFISNSHLSLNGDTVDNYETGSASPDNLKVLVRRLKLLPRQGGGLGGYHFNGLLSPLNQIETFIEITDSELKANTGNNNLNWVSNLYPGVRVGTSEYLHSDYNSLNTNVNTTYFAVASPQRHRVTHLVREALTTKFNDPLTSESNTGYYRARFRECAFPGTWSGVAASDGTV